MRRAATLALAAAESRRNFRTARGTPPPLDGVNAESTNPVSLITTWIAEAKGKGEREAEGFALATVSSSGLPSVRPMLLKDADERLATFTFATNAATPKGDAMANGGPVAMCFHWKSLSRMARVEGRAARLDDASAQRLKYWESRSRASRIGAWASPQTSIAREGRASVVASIRAFEEKFDGVADIPPPPHFAAFSIAADRIEFWSSLHAEGFYSEGAYGEKDRIGERVAFVKDVDGAASSSWRTEALFP